jgi:2-alkyl-3-oxoalkanoate reductase
VGRRRRPDTKNAADAALAQVCGLTTVLVRPPAILGTGETSMWNTLRPQEVRMAIAAEPATWRDYHGTVTDALGVEPEWTDEPVWTGQLRTDRARRWGWGPRAGLAEALDELRQGLTTRT